jgi:hypothetical protein
VLDQRLSLHAHVLGIQVGQPLGVNSDAALHNVHALPKANSEFNAGQPPPVKTTHVQREGK